MRLLPIALFAAAAGAPVMAAAEATTAPPWVRNVAPDRACIRFGSFDWLRYIRESDNLRAKDTTKRVAIARDQQLGEALWYLGRGTGRICSCGGKEAVLADLRRMLPELKKRSSIRYQDMPAADHVAGAIAGIEAEGIAVVPPAHEGCTR